MRTDSVFQRTDFRMCFNSNVFNSKSIAWRVSEQLIRIYAVYLSSQVNKTECTHARMHATYKYTLTFDCLFYSLSLLHSIHFLSHSSVCAISFISYFSVFLSLHLSPSDRSLVLFQSFLLHLLFFFLFIINNWPMGSITISYAAKEEK